MKGRGFHLSGAGLAMRFFMVLMVCALGLGSVAPPVEASPSAGALTPLEGLLNADGTLDLGSGFTGSVDPSGWRMEYAADGAPRFVPARPQVGLQATIGSDSDWDLSFGDQGAKSEIHALAIDATHNLVYVGGLFSSVGGVNGTMYIGVWNGTNWAPLGAGTTGGVYALAVDPNTYDVYVGGEFLLVYNDASTSVSANRVAVWDYDTGTWGSLGTSVSNGVSGGSYTQVNAIAIDSRDAFSYVYVGGDFNTVADTNGTQDAGFVARFYTNPDDWTWSVLGSSGSGENGTNGVVYALALEGTNGLMYVGGAFNTVYNSSTSSVSASNVAVWNIDSPFATKWDNLGSGTNGSVLALAVNESVSPVEVYVGGSFTTAGGSSINNVGMWNGTTWYPLGNTSSNGANNTVRALSYDTTNNRLFVAGEFTQVSDASGDTATIRVAYWSGGWQAMGAGLDATGRALAVNGNDLFVGGDFITAGGLTVNRIARWTASSWNALGQGLGNSVYAIVIDGTDVYVGGVFSKAGGMTVNNVARWDGSQWHSLGDGTNSFVYALAYDTNYKELYVGGAFTQVTQSGGTTLGAIHIAKWNTLTNQWSQLGNDTSNGVAGGLSPSVEALVYDASAGTVYVGGGFEQVKDPTNGTQTVNHLARWLPGFNYWQPVGGGVDGPIYALALDGNDDLYVGGNFSLAGGSVTTSYIARWDGSTWHALTDGGGSGSEGTGGIVYALATRGTTLYAGGDFDAAGNWAAHNVAKWDGTNWSILGLHNNVTDGNGVNDTVRALAVSTGGGYVHVGGDFTTAYNSGSSTISANRIAVWNVGSSAWDTYGATGMNGSVRAIAFGGSSYLGGDFGSAGGQPSRYIARFTQVDPNAVVVTGLQTSGTPMWPMVGLLLVSLVGSVVVGLALHLRRRLV